MTEVVPVLGFNEETEQYEVFGIHKDELPEPWEENIVEEDDDIWREEFENIEGGDTFEVE